MSYYSLSWYDILAVYYMRKLDDILKGNNASTSPSLPLVHSAPAYFIQKIIESNKIRTRNCDVFLGESLSYFFVGRPAYKALNKDILHWELPSCIICDFNAMKPKRIFPFDSGAFSKGFIPSYANMIELDDFALSIQENTVQRYIGTFFGTTDNYFKGTPVNKNDFLAKHNVLPTEASVHAMLALISGDRIAKELDNRRSAIEFQFDKEIDLADAKVLAIIIPEIYLQDKNFIESICDEGYDIITYPIFPLNSDAYYYALFERCYNYYIRKGFIDV